MDAPPPHLSAISTWWGCVRDANGGDRGALARLVDRYTDAVDRYLLKCLGDPHDAADLRQEFFRRFASGDFWAAAPEHGRFRRYIKTVLVNLVRGLRRDFARHHPPGRAVERAAAEDEAGFDAAWRAAIEERAWAELARAETLPAAPPLHTVLRWKAENPEATADELAARLTAVGAGGRVVSPSRVRQLLSQARARFATAVVAEVTRSLVPPSPEAVRAELDALGLLGLPHVARVLTAREAG